MTYGLTEGGECRTVEEAITIGTALRRCWFRGHSRMVGALAPAVHREPFCSAREYIEFWAGQRFRLRASEYATDVPRWEDHLSWLLLAQHHGVPTRLLDWRENVLVGLYFAVTGADPLENGELWCMHHDELNARSANWKACFPDTPPIRYLAAEVFVQPDSLDRFKNELGKTVIHGPLALIPPLQFPRMAVQMSRFTIHPSRKPEAQIEFLLRGPSLVRYIVPASVKLNLAKQLSRIGFSHETLFRSLDSLAQSIKEEIVEPDFDISPPPRFPGRELARECPEGI
jgi:FRG domain